MRDFIFLHKVEFAVLLIIGSIVLNLLLRISKVLTLIATIADDTLKVNDGLIRRYSATKMTMFVAFLSIVWSYHYITIKDGFNEVAFITMTCIATGVSITNAWSKKISPPTETTDETKDSTTTKN